MGMQSIIQDCISRSIAVKQQILADDRFLSRIEQAVEIITEAFNAGHKVWFCGNGGSAADAQHLAAEFSGRFYLNRKALPAEAFHCNTSYLTAVANDYHFEDIYARLIEGLTGPGDVLIGLSTSGNSANIVKAFKAARAAEVVTIGFTGKTGGQLQPLTDLLFNVPDSDTPRIQEAHILIGHIICQLVEANIFGG
ncbi:D-sedoheptulose 7-phosphate isomerase [Arachidicoccus ginsenosidivorans]|jgi:D-sedoheptulose 7-phosphate isomerase|uniref:Phosphoheptose isomerase n=2 Tax=Arachidicoccus ginsenosidivorans TaxID=496057 RepID=A0A5B8VJ49_9BACT|nr:SIS domain-containing protein [Arachidicoccus ginsenosidivorans]